MASVQTAKRGLQSETLAENYKALKEIDEGKSCISVAKKYGVAKNIISHWLQKKKQIYESVEENTTLRRKGSE